MVSSLPHGNLHFSISGKRFTGTQVHGKAHFRQLIIGKTRWVGAFGLHMHCSDLGGGKGIKCTLIGVDMPITGLGKRGRLDKGDDTLNDVENSRPPSPSWGTQPSSPPRFSGKQQCYPEQAWRVLIGPARKSWGCMRKYSDGDSKYKDDSNNDSWTAAAQRPLRTRVPRSRPDQYHDGRIPLPDP